jgi:hypothetical protein
MLGGVFATLALLLVLTIVALYYSLSYSEDPAVSAGPDYVGSFINSQKPRDSKDLKQSAGEAACLEFVLAPCLVVALVFTWKGIRRLDRRP